MSRLTLTTTVVFLHFGLSAVQATAEPRVQFDVSRTVACHTISDVAQPAVQPGEKLIQARVSVSLLAYRGEAEDVDECLYRFESGTGTTQVVDYLPRTTMDSSVEGNIRVQRNEEKSSQLNLSVNGGFEIVQADGGGSKSEASRAAMEYELIPPQDVVAAVGTTSRSTGVYFKLRRTPQISLEGSRDFLITLRVPIDWRGGYFRAHCQAVQRTQRDSQVVGTGTFVVPLYLAGDLQSKRLAENLSNSEQRLYAAALKNQREVHRRSLPTIAHELSLVDPKIPRAWLQQVLEHSSPTGDGLAFEARLPSELKSSIDEYRLARLGLTQLRTSPTQAPPTKAPSPNLITVNRPTTPPMTSDQPAKSNAWQARAQ